MTAADIRLSRTTRDLVITVLSADGSDDSTLTVKDYYMNDAAKIEAIKLSDGSVLFDADDFAAVGIEGGSGRDYLHGLAGIDDVFDSDGGGDDGLYGYSGNDVYWLGRGTGHDVIREYFRNSGDTGDVIRIKSGIAASDVRVCPSEDGRHLVVELLDEGEVTDSLEVQGHFVIDSAKVEHIELMDGPDGTVGTTFDDTGAWLSAVRTGDGVSADLYGADDIVDIFDAGAGDQNLYGRGGNDVYWLGQGTGHDTIKEYEGNTGTGDSGDVIRIRSGIVANEVRIRRSADGDDLIIELLDAPNGSVTDSLTVDGQFSEDSGGIERIELMDGAGGTVWTRWDKNGNKWLRGGPHYDELKGHQDGDKSDTSNVFDSDAGGDDYLYGYGGNDVYWLGRGTDHDTIREGYNDRYSRRDDANDPGDVIRIKSGIADDEVNLRRSVRGSHLIVELLDGPNGRVTDSMTIWEYYTKDVARVERIEFMGGVNGGVGTVWDIADFSSPFLPTEPIRGNGYSNLFHESPGPLYGSNDVDIFDSDAGGNDGLYGHRGDDVYWLGRGTDHDTIVEGHQGRSSANDPGDVIRIKQGISEDEVRLRRSADGDDLYVMLLDGGRVTDSLTIYDYYTNDAARVERIEFMDGPNGEVGTMWNDLAERASSLPILERIRGGPHDDRDLYGADDVSDIFDGDAGGNDTLHGYGGNDVYWLGRGTDHDTIIEAHRGRSSANDPGDVIRIKSGIAENEVHLRRSHDRRHLYVELLDGPNGRVTDSLRIEDYYTNDAARVERIEFMDGPNGEVGTMWNDLAERASSLPIPERIRGSGRNESLSGAGAGVNDISDIFDGDAGGNDDLYGYGGNDVYWLGRGTDHDAIREGRRGRSSAHDPNDVIRIKSGITEDEVHLRRSDDGHDLIVELLDGPNGRLTDSMTIVDYYTNASARVERIEFMDGVNGGVGTVWGIADFSSPFLPTEPIRGNGYGNSLHGSNGVDIFDGDRGRNDDLYGYGGNDVYWLGRGTDHDAIREAHYRRSSANDPNDVIRIKSGISTDRVCLRRSDNGDDLYVELSDGPNGRVTDSLRIEDYYTNDAARVERIEFMDGANGGVETVWNDLAERASSLPISERIRGTGRNETLLGSSFIENDISDIFDSDAGGNDRLSGLGGDDVYWLGRGTDHDVIVERYYKKSENDPNDVIRIKSGIAENDVRVRRSDDGSDLIVELLDGPNGRVTDSLTIRDYYTDARARVERIEFMDGEDGGVETVWDLTKEFPVERLRGGFSRDDLWGSNGADIFDDDVGGNDRCTRPAHLRQTNHFCLSDWIKEHYNEPC